MFFSKENAILSRLRPSDFKVPRCASVVVHISRDRVAPRIHGAMFLARKKVRQ